MMLLYYEEKHLKHFYIWNYSSKINELRIRNQILVNENEGKPCQFLKPRLVENIQYDNQRFQHEKIITIILSQ